jgi:hypothetical protein
VLGRCVGVDGEPREPAPLRPEHRRDRLRAPIDATGQVVLDACLELLVELAQAPYAGDGHEVAAAEASDLALDPPFSCAPAIPGVVNSDSNR